MSGLTSGVSYSLKPTAVKCSRRTLTIPSSNKLTFAPSETAVLYVPSLKNHVLDPAGAYLRFKVTVTGAGYIDVSAHSFIERLVTYASGQVIDDINCYRSIATALLDAQLSIADKVGLSAMLGTEDKFLEPVAGTAVTAGGVTQAECDALLLPPSNRRGKAVANGATYQFCIPILNPCIGSLAEKMWPSFSLSDDLRLEFTFSSTTNCLVASTDYSISNPELVIDALEFESSTFDIIKQTYGGANLVIPAQSYHYYSSLIASGTSANISQIIPAKQRSARAMFFRFRPADTQVTAGYATGSSVNPFYTANDNFSLNIGGQRVPTKPISTDVASKFPNWFASTQMALHAMNSLQMNGSITETYYNRSCYNALYKATGLSYQNAFLLGINLNGLTNNETANSGTDLSSVTTYYEGFLAVAPTVVGATIQQSVTVDCFVLHDTAYVIDELGGCTLRM